MSLSNNQGKVTTAPSCPAPQPPKTGTPSMPAVFPAWKCPPAHETAWLRSLIPTPQSGGLPLILQALTPLGASFSHPGLTLSSPAVSERRLTRGGPSPDADGGQLAFSIPHPLPPACTHMHAAHSSSFGNCHYTRPWPSRAFFQEETMAAYSDSIISHFQKKIAPPL